MEVLYCNSTQVQGYSIYGLEVQGIWKKAGFLNSAGRSTFVDVLTEMMWAFLLSINCDCLERSRRDNLKKGEVGEVLTPESSVKMFECRDRPLFRLFSREQTFAPKMWNVQKCWRQFLAVCIELKPGSPVYSAADSLLQLTWLRWRIPGNLDVSLFPDLLV